MRIVADGDRENESSSHLASTASLAENLHFYWPTGHNEVPEPNISLRVGHALMEAGFFAYAEAQT